MSFRPFRVYPSWFLLLLISCIPFLSFKSKLSIALYQWWCWPTLVQNYRIPPYLHFLVSESLKRWGYIFFLPSDYKYIKDFVSGSLNLIVSDFCPLFLIGFAISFLFGHFVPSLAFFKVTISLVHKEKQGQPTSTQTNKSPLSFHFTLLFLNLICIYLHNRCSDLSQLLPSSDSSVCTSL